MRKPIHARSSPIQLNELTDDNRAVSPFGKLDGDDTRFSIGYRVTDGSWKTLSITDPEVVAEIRDQADEWLDNHDEYQE